jgi:hypothetical protein
MFLKFLRLLSEQLKFKYAFLHHINHRYHQKDFVNHFFFYLLSRLPSPELDKVVVEAFASYGHGDLHNAFKTAKMLREQDHEAIISVSCHQECADRIGESYAESYDLEDSVFCRKTVNEQLTDESKVVVFQVAVPDFRRTIRGKTNYVMVDEYNGHRFRECKPKKGKPCSCGGDCSDLRKMKQEVVYWLVGGVGFNPYGFPTCGFHFQDYPENIPESWNVRRHFYPIWGPSYRTYFAYNSDSCDWPERDHPKRYTLAHLKRYILSVIEMEKENTEPIQFMILGIHLDRFYQLGLHETLGIQQQPLSSEQEDLRLEQYLEQARRNFNFSNKGESESESESEGEKEQEEKEAQEHTFHLHIKQYLVDMVHASQYYQHAYSGTMYFTYKGKKILFRLWKSMTHDDLLYSLRKSCEPVFITGDQSLVEAISMDKLFFYQMMAWKTALYSNYCKFVRYILEPPVKVIGRKRKRAASETYSNKRRRFRDSEHTSFHVHRATEYIGISPLIALHELMIGDCSQTNHLGNRRIEEESKVLGSLLRDHWDQIQRDKKNVYKKLKKYYDIRDSFRCVIKFTSMSNMRIKQELKELTQMLLQAEPDFHLLEERYQRLEIRLQKYYSLPG